MFSTGNASQVKTRSTKMIWNARDLSVDGFFTFLIEERLVLSPGGLSISLVVQIPASSYSNFISRQGQSRLAKDHKFLPNCTNFLPKYPNFLPKYPNFLPGGEKNIFFTLEILATHQTVSPYPAKWCLRKKTPGLSWHDYESDATL